MNEIPKFIERNSNKIWNDYFRRIRKNLILLNQQQKQDMIKELEGHIYESFMESDGENETEKLLNALERMGDPDEFLKPLLSKELLIKGTKSFSLIAIFKGLYLNIYAGLKAVFLSLVFGVGFLLSVSMAIVAAAKLIIPDKVGLFLFPDGNWSFGIISNIGGANEILGYWIIPICLSFSVTLYIFLTYLVKKVFLQK